MQCNTFINLEIFKINHTLQILLLPPKYYNKYHINIVRYQFFQYLNVYINNKKN